MLEYAVIKKNRREHVALTGLSAKEFAKLLIGFEQAEQEKLKQRDAKKGEATPTGRRKATDPS
jgi:hypothetical protein